MSFDEQHTGSEDHIVASIVCRTADNTNHDVDPLRENTDFIVPGIKDGHPCEALLKSCQINLPAHRTFTIGRIKCPSVNSISVNNPYVSRKHFEIYTIIFEENGENDDAMVYVKDCQSLSGTHVNGKMIGSRSSGACRGYLLSDGDIIGISPFWEFQISLNGRAKRKSLLGGIQRNEAGMFRHQYHITSRLLGSGSFCSVYLARNATTDKQLACKVVDLTAAGRMLNSEKILSVVRGEADILSRVRHPNILTYECAFRSKNTVYIFTELASGGDLFSMLQSHEGALTEDQVKFVMHQVARGLAYLHHEGVVHRDLKPENIFFASGPGFKNRVLIGDLGGAKGISWGRMKTQVGTAIYSAPELRRGNSEYSQPVDIWALGMIVLFLVSPCGRDKMSSMKELDQASLGALLKAIFHHHDAAERPLSTDCKDFVRRCLRIEPSQRMRAQQAKKHPWLQLDEQLQTEVEVLRRDFWNPTHRIPPPISELGDLSYVACSPLHEPSQENISTFREKPTTFGTPQETDDEAMWSTFIPGSVESNEKTSPHFAT